jgi:Ca2+-binding RTX toxin-like protein
MIGSGLPTSYARLMRTLARLRTLAWPVLLSAALVGLVLTPTPAAAGGCTFNSGTATVSVSLGTGTATISVGAGGAIVLDGASCGTATVDNTDTVDVTGSPGSRFSIDLSGGAFAPGASGEGSGQAEIEFSADLGGTGTLEIRGGSGADRVAAGTDGVNINAGERDDDVDVTLQGVAAIEINGGDGKDVLTADGEQGTGSISTTKATIGGGGGNDFLAGSGSTDTLRGGEGTDTVDYSAAGTSVYVTELPNTTVTSTIGSDVLRDVENVIGSPASDFLSGGPGRNVLRGGTGNDVFGGGGGNDAFVGGPGDDKADFTRAPARMVVNLAKGTARGDGRDKLRSIERAEGSRFSDRIVGTRKANEVNGGAGSDTITVGGGDDSVRGGDGNDSIKGGPGNDSLYGEAGSDAVDGGTGYDICTDTSGQNRIRGCEIP